MIGDKTSAVVSVPVHPKHVELGKGQDSVLASKLFYSKMGKKIFHHGSWFAHEGHVENQEKASSRLFHEV